MTKQVKSLAIFYHILSKSLINLQGDRPSYIMNLQTVHYSTGALCYGGDSCLAAPSPLQNFSPALGFAGQTVGKEIIQRLKGGIFFRVLCVLCVLRVLPWEVPFNFCALRWENSDNHEKVLGKPFTKEKVLGISGKNCITGCYITIIYH